MRGVAIGAAIMAAITVVITVAIGAVISAAVTVVTGAASVVAGAGAASVGAWELAGRSAGALLTTAATTSLTTTILTAATAIPDELGSPIVMATACCGGFWSATDQARKVAVRLYRALNAIIVCSRDRRVKAAVLLVRQTDAATAGPTGCAASCF